MDIMSLLQDGREERKLTRRNAAASAVDWSLQVNSGIRWKYAVSRWKYAALLGLLKKDPSAAGYCEQGQLGRLVQIFRGYIAAELLLVL